MASPGMSATLWAPNTSPVMAARVSAGRARLSATRSSAITPPRGLRTTEVTEPTSTPCSCTRSLRFRPPPFSRATTMFVPPRSTGVPSSQ